MSHKVFVYGTLMQGEAHHNFLANAKLLAEQAWVKGTLFETDDYFPALIEGDETVYGELYEVSDSELAALDELEEYFMDPNRDLYERKSLEVGTDGGRHVAYGYLLVKPRRAMLQGKIPHQNWKVHQWMKEKDYLYFAYGSCMDNDRFKKAGVDHLFTDCLGRGVLEGYTLKFAMKGTEGGAADIVEDGGVVEGKVYRVNREALDYLYVREGVQAGHYRPQVISVTLNGEKVDVLTFIVIDKHDELTPTEIYATEILRGGKETLSKDYWDALHQRIKTDFKINVKI